MAPSGTGQLCALTRGSKDNIGPQVASKLRGQTRVTAI
jgi:hypothetical protein